MEDALMPKNTPPPTCKKCRKPMRWLLAKAGGRKFRCSECDGSGLLQTAAFLSGALAPVKSSARLQSLLQKTRDEVESLPPGEKHDALVRQMREIQRAISFAQD
jgi:hypothetical protein